MYNYNKGNSFAQYAIVLAILAMGCVFVYFTLGNIIHDKLNFFSDNMDKSAKAVTFKNDNGTFSSYQPGDLEGTPDNPVSKCNGDACILDYGDYILSGIPANFEDESTSSRGTDQLTQVMQGMLDQLEAENNPPDDDVSELIKLIKQTIQQTNIIADAEQVLEIAALDVYLGQDTPGLNESQVFQAIIQNIGNNPQYAILNDMDLIDLPNKDEPLSPETQIFRDMVWQNDPNYSSAVIDATQISQSTDTIQALKSDILTTAASCGKSEQGETIAYLIDLVSQISTETQEAASNGEDILSVKSIVDNKDVNIVQELKNIAQGIDPSLGNQPPY